MALGGALADLNGDGEADLIISGGPYSQVGFGVWLSNGDGTFQAPVLYQVGDGGVSGNPIVGDFNGDGIPDIVVPG